MNITTPALLFPAISLLLLAYTNRFLVLAQLIRQLHGKRSSPEGAVVKSQIANLKKRLFLIKAMQALGVMSFLTCTLTMLLLFHNHSIVAEILFGSSLILLVISLFFSLYEIMISTQAIEIQLNDLKDSCTTGRDPDRQTPHSTFSE